MCVFGAIPQKIHKCFHDTTVALASRPSSFRDRAGFRRFGGWFPPGLWGGDPQRIQDVAKCQGLLPSHGQDFCWMIYLENHPMTR